MKTMGIFNQIHVNVTLDLQDVKFDDGLPVNIWVKCGLEPLPLLRGNRLFERRESPFNCPQYSFYHGIFLTTAIGAGL